MNRKISVSISDNFESECNAEMNLLYLLFASYNHQYVKWYRLPVIREVNHYRLSQLSINRERITKAANIWRSSVQLGGNPLKYPRHRLQSLNNAYSPEVPTAHLSYANMRQNNHGQDELADVVCLNFLF